MDREIADGRPKPAGSPLVVAPDAWDAWLAGEEVPLGPYPADAMTAHPVSTHVNRPANDNPRCVEPVSLR